MPNLVLKKKMTHAKLLQERQAALLVGLTILGAERLAAYTVGDEAPLAGALVRAHARAIDARAAAIRAARHCKLALCMMRSEVSDEALPLAAVGPVDAARLHCVEQVDCHHVGLQLVCG